MTSFKNLKLFNQFNQIEEEGNKENSITKENNKIENEEKILKENKEVNKKDNKKDIFITTRVDKDTKAKFKIACINKGIKESEALSFLINKFINS